MSRAYQDISQYIDICQRNGVGVGITTMINYHELEITPYIVHSLNFHDRSTLAKVMV